MIDAPHSRGINICGQILDVDPRTGKTLVNCAKPFSKRDWNAIAKNHVVTLVHADGSERLVTIAGAKHKELRDGEFVHSIATSGKMKHTLSEGDWHACVLKLADRYPDKVVSSPAFSSVSRVVVAAIVPPPNPAQVRLSHK